MKKSIAFLISTTCFLLGIVIGYLISPAKQGFGNNSGNTRNYYLSKEDKNTITPNEHSN